MTDALFGSSTRTVGPREVTSSASGRWGRRTNPANATGTEVWASNAISAVVSPVLTLKMRTMPSVAAVITCDASSANTAPTTNPVWPRNSRRVRPDCKYEGKTRKSDNHHRLAVTSEAVSIRDISEPLIQRSCSFHPDWLI
jgi:hypothetical protein